MTARGDRNEANGDHARLEIASAGLVLCATAASAAASHAAAGVEPVQTLT